MRRCRTFIGVAVVALSILGCQKQETLAPAASQPAEKPAAARPAAAAAESNVHVLFTGLSTFQHEPRNAGTGGTTFTSVEFPKVDAERNAKLTTGFKIPRHFTYLLFDPSVVTLASNPKGLTVEAAPPNSRLGRFSYIELSGVELQRAAPERSGVEASYDRPAGFDCASGKEPPVDTMFWIPSVSRVSEYQGSSFNAVEVFARVRLDGGSLSSWPVDGFNRRFGTNTANDQPMAQIVDWAFRVDNAENRVTFVDEHKNLVLSFTFKTAPAVFVIGSASMEDWHKRSDRMPRDAHFEVYYDALKEPQKAKLNIPEDSGTCKAYTLPEWAPPWLSPVAYSKWVAANVARGVIKKDDPKTRSIGGMDCGPDGQP